MITVLPSDTRIDGLTLGEWAAQWWQWAYSIPKLDNPVDDRNGTKSDREQAGSVYFLAGSFQNLPTARITRNATVPKQKFIFFPVANAIFSTVEVGRPNISERELFVKAATDIDRATSLAVRIDNSISLDTATIKQNYRIVSPSFQVQIPESAVQSLPAGTARAAADGYYICLAPNSFDPNGNPHTIDIDATIPQAAGASSFDTHVTYNLNAQ